MLVLSTLHAKGGGCCLMYVSHVDLTTDLNMSAQTGKGDRFANSWRRYLDSRHRHNSNTSTTKARALLVSLLMLTDT